MLVEQLLEKDIFEETDKESIVTVIILSNSMFLESSRNPMNDADLFVRPSYCSLTSGATRRYDKAMEKILSF